MIIKFDTSFKIGNINLKPGNGIFHY